MNQRPDADDVRSAYRQIGSLSLYGCGVCGAVVTFGDMEKHNGWHQYLIDRFGHLSSAQSDGEA